MPVAAPTRRLYRISDFADKGGIFIKSEASTRIFAYMVQLYDDVHILMNLCSTAPTQGNADCEFCCISAVADFSGEGIQADITTTDMEAFLDEILEDTPDADE